MSEIYALTDLDGSVRYIGKANVAADRLKCHLRDARRRSTPVYVWIRQLAEVGCVPGLIVLETCDDWQEAERRIIAEHRAAGARLLNLAPGGNEPFCPADVRAANGRANARKRHKRKWFLMRAMGDALRRGHVAETTKAKMRARPDVFGQFSAYL